MQGLKEITSALCDIHMILTHLVGIEMTQEITIRTKAERLEGHAFQTLNRLADLALLVDIKKAARPEECSEFEKLLRLVSTMLLRGSDSEAQERRKVLLEKMKPGCDELSQTLERLSIGQMAVEEEAAMDIM